VQGHDLGPKLEGDRPHAEQALRYHEYQQQEWQLERLRRLMAMSPGLQGDDEDEKAQGAGEVAMHHFRPGLLVLERRIGEGRLGRCNLLAGVGPQHVAITAGPVGAAEPCIFQAREGAEHHDAHGQQDRQLHESMGGLGAHHGHAPCKEGVAGAQPRLL
jgi:hypothetical protein